MTEAKLFACCGQILCGDGPRWKEQFGLLLQVKTDSIDAFSKGEKRIPPGVWSDVHTALIRQYNALPDLIYDAARYAGSSPSGATNEFQTAVTSGPRPSRGRIQGADPVMPLSDEERKRRW